MNAAIYARKSTDDSDRADGARAIPRQIEGARNFVEQRGWTLTRVYKDANTSGALFATREEFQHMLRDAEAGRFTELVIFDIDRYGRDGQKTMESLHRLADLGVTVWDYSTQQSIDLSTFEGRLGTTLKAEFAQQFREQVRKHTKATMRRNFLNGYVAGGKVFGYDNIGPKSQKVRVINDAEAEVVREIFRRYANGQGYKKIAWDLNALGLPSPRAQQGRPSGWESGTIRSLLDNSMYRGVEYYGRSVKAYGREIPRDKRTQRRRGHKTEAREKGQFRTSEDAWLQRTCPRIVDPELAAAVDARRLDRSSRYLRTNTGQLLGKPARHTRYLLSGLLICPCGARFEAIKGSHGKRPGNIYMCAARRRKGPTVCKYDLVFPIEETDRRILNVIDGDVLHPRFIDYVLESLEQGMTDAERTRLESERDALQKEIGNLTAAVAHGGDIPQLVSMIKERDRRLKKLEARLVPQDTPDRQTLRAALEQRCEDWRDVLRSRKPEQGRMVLMQLMGPLEVGIGEAPSWLSYAQPGGILTGLVHQVASPPGFEPGF